MTDATDIAALRSLCESAKDCGYAHHVYVDGRLLESILDQLEAERLRADDRAKENYRNKCDVDNCMEAIANLESELASLKGEQVPMACESDEVICSWGRDNHINGGADRLRNVIKSAINLFTAPQKPVVLPDSVVMQNVKDIAHCLSDIRRFVEAKFMTIGDLPSPEGLLLSGPEWKHESDAIIAALNRVAEYYEQPQKPVVLPESIITVATEFAEELDSVAHHEFSDDSAPYSAKLASAIEAAGGIVKTEGEQ